MRTVYLGLGSNVGEREKHLQTAVDKLSREVRIARASSVYETQPMERRNQRWFLNLALQCETALFPRQLLARIARIERELGRRRTVKNGPRTIDIDILFFGDFVVKTPELEIPHPRFAGRRFVLEPMAELAPEFRDPVSRRTMRDLLGEATGQDVKRVKFTVMI